MIVITRGYIPIIIIDCLDLYGYGSIPMKIPFLGGWTSIFNPAILMWTEGVQGFDTLPYPIIISQFWLVFSPYFPWRIPSVQIFQVMKVWSFEHLWCRIFQAFLAEFEGGLWWVFATDGPVIRRFFNDFNAFIPCDSMGFRPLVMTVT